MKNGMIKLVFLFVILGTGCKKDYGTSDVKCTVNSNNYYASKNRQGVFKIHTAVENDSLHIFLYCNIPKGLPISISIGNYIGTGKYVESDIKVKSDIIVYDGNTSGREYFVLDSINIAQVEINELSKNRISGSFNFGLVRHHYDTLGWFEPQFDHELNIEKGSFSGLKVK